MKNMAAALTVVLTLVSGSSALAQSKDNLVDMLGEVLGGLMSGKQGTQDQLWHGHLVQAKGTTLTFRSEDGTVYAVDMSAINTQTWHPIALGTPLTLAARPGAAPHTLIAARIEPEQPDRSGRLRANRPFRTVHGRVERVEGSQVTVRTSDGMTLSVDVAQITGESELRTNDSAVAILEPAPGNAVVWIDREERSAQNRRGDYRGEFRGDILAGLGSEYQKVHGHLVRARGTSMIFRADNGKTSAVDMSAINAQTWHPIGLGQALTLAARPGNESNALVAARLQADASDRSTGKAPKRAFLTAQGTVESMRGSQMRFRTIDGKVLTANASQMPGRAAIRTNEHGTLTFEQGARGPITALWLERDEVQPAAAVNTGQFQRISGYVQSIGWSTMSLKTDDGRVLAIDTSHIEARLRDGLRPGDLVTVVARPTARADQFIADVMERETRR